jgi:2,3-dihydroxy-p-cumate/2,3-dihydroxybenzoate 3,4-dioxygenase
VSADHLALVAIAYARIAARDAPASARFASEIVGLQSAREEDGEIALRSDERSRSLVFASEIEPSLGVEAWDEAALDPLEARLREAGFSARRASPEESRARRVRAAIFTRDATGNAIEIVAQSERSGRRFFGARDAGLMGFSSIGLRSIDIAGDLRFWRALGAEIRDHVGEIAYLAIDDAHHRIALYPSRATGLLYLAFEVASVDDLMRGHYFLAERQIRIVQGPGRQPASEQVFLHFQGPEGLVYAYVTGMARGFDKPRPPRQFPRTAESLCAWGSRADGAPELSP